MFRTTPIRPRSTPVKPCSGLLSALVVAGAAIALAGPAAAGPKASDLLTNFNVITQGNYSNSSESVGGLLIGGTLTGTGGVDTGSVGQSGAVSGLGGVNVYGSAIGANNVGGGVTVDVAGTNADLFSGAGHVNSGYAFPYTFSSLFATLTSLSTGLAGLTTSAGVTLSTAQNMPGVTVTGTPTAAGYSGIAVLNITGTQWNAINSAAGQFQLNLSNTTLLVVNVNCASGGCNGTGTTNYNDASAAGGLLWNFEGATALNFGVEFGGTILATGATVSNSTAVDGTVVANTVNGNGEFHNAVLNTASGNNTPFLNYASGGGGTTNGTSVPEPSSLVLLAAGLLALPIIRQRGRARAK